MKINSNTRLDGENITLVPYFEEHVKRYHQWMSDPEMRELTASEELTLEEEYENQISWREDEHIMCGDVNLFFHSFLNEEEESNKEEEHNEANPYQTGEMEVMIAEVKSRGRGVASEAIHLMMSYAHHHLRTKVFLSKIGEDNEKSRRLFAKLGYRQTAEPNYFREITMQLDYTTPTPLPPTSEYRK
ncbi:hypothetical protein PROFUN_12801 [Planoprotostelium fungivorum]|uniref:N-acetyltransferase domain-containing protein n=1 Tax=Planoprotostelium fungivorum TaxID=1890364 RepID=A0A2P6N6N5_9EUKA|nr:hypothetical protein PROFUN_12801 [Planoprotostelium fungivorum]